MRVSDEPQGGPLEATTPPATAGEWRVTPWPDRGYSELHLGPLPTNRKSFGTTRFTVGPPSKAQQLADVLNRRDHNAASRLRIAEEALRRLLEETQWTTRETSEWANGCAACSGLDGNHDDDCALLAARAVLDALKGGGHE